MAHSSVTILTQRVTRDLLAEMANNQRVIKLLENLTQDVSVGIPDGMDEIQAETASARFLADLAGMIAGKALELAEMATSSPIVPAALVDAPAIPILFAAPDEAPAVAVSSSAPLDIPDNLGARVADLESRLQAAELRIASLEGGPSS